MRCNGRRGREMELSAVKTELGEITAPLCDSIFDKYNQWALAATMSIGEAPKRIVADLVGGAIDSKLGRGL